MTTIGAVNAAKIRSGICWECDQPLRLIPSLLERWRECDPCGRRFLVVSDLLIVERIWVDDELVGRRVDLVFVDEPAPLVREDGSAFDGELVEAGLWLESLLPYRSAF